MKNAELHNHRNVNRASACMQKIQLTIINDTTNEDDKLDDRLVVSTTTL